MIKKFKVNDKLKTQILIGTFSLVFTVSGFMLCREHLSNKNNEEVHFITDEDYIYEKYIFNNKNGEMEYVGLISVDIPPRDTNTVHYKYYDTYYEIVPVEDQDVLYVYDKYKVDSNGEFEYVGEFPYSVPPKDDLHTHYKFKKSITMPEEENKNDKTR